MVLRKHLQGDWHQAMIGGIKDPGCGGQRDYLWRGSIHDRDGRGAGSVVPRPVSHGDGDQVSAEINPGAGGGILRLHQRRSRSIIVRGNEVGDRKSTRLNSSHLVISYAVFCLK